MYSTYIGHIYDMYMTCFNSVYTTLYTTFNVSSFLIMYKEFFRILKK